MLISGSCLPCALLLTHVKAAFPVMTRGSGQGPARSLALLTPTQFPLGLPQQHCQDAPTS